MASRENGWLWPAARNPNPIALHKHSERQRFGDGRSVTPDCSQTHTHTHTHCSLSDGQKRATRSWAGQDDANLNLSGSVHSHASTAIALSHCPTPLHPFAPSRERHDDKTFLLFCKKGSFCSVLDSAKTIFARLKWHLVLSWGDAQKVILKAQTLTLLRMSYHPTVR